MVNRLQTIQVYLDQPLMGGLISWFEDTILLWMVAQISGVKVKRSRFILGGAIGGLFQFLMSLSIVSGGILNSWVWSPLVYILIVPLFMVGLTFAPLNIKTLFRVLAYIYLLSFLLVGFHSGLDIINQRFFHWQISVWWRFLFHSGLILIMGELGWGIVHRKFWEQICLYPVQISWGDRVLKMNALLDTGNRLHDPITKMPVMIVELKRIKDLLPVELIQWVENIQGGELGLEIKLPDFWEERIRILPFHSLGKDHGLLVGFRSDEVKVWLKQQAITSPNVIIGLYNKSLSREGAFHALIPPTVLRS
jgi:stage II sporulation protein GA (sporulation sigma-E factor processing peptidase)